VARETSVPLTFRNSANFRHSVPAQEVIRKSRKLLREVLDQKTVDGRLVPYAEVDSRLGQCFLTADEGVFQKARKALETAFN
jgi:hypothetical protein